MQQQINSMLRFALYYYNEKSLKIREVKMQGKFFMIELLMEKEKLRQTPENNTLKEKTESQHNAYIREKLISNSPFSSYHYFNFHINTSSTSQKSNLTKKHELLIQTGTCGIEDRKQSQPDNIGSPQETVQQQKFFSQGPFPLNSDIPIRKSSSFYMLPESDPNVELEVYKKEYEKIKSEINELLESRENILKIQPTTVSNNLKQVLRNLESFKKNSKVIIDESDDDDYELGDIEAMVANLLKAFNSAQQKTFKRVLYYLTSKRMNAHNLLYKDQGTMVNLKKYF